MNSTEVHKIKIIVTWAEKKYHKMNKQKDKTTNTYAHFP